MKLFKVFPLIILIVIPLFWEAMNIKLIGDVDSTLGNIFITYACLVIFLIRYIPNYKFNDHYYFTRLKPLIIFNIIIIVIYFLQNVFSLSQVLSTLNIIKSNLFSLTLILYFSTYSKQKIKKEIKYILFLIAILFLIQLVLSAWESYWGVVIFGGAEWINKVAIDAKLETRLIFSILTNTLFISEYFINPFSGLLGQWNYWGTQLPIYNLIFWFIPVVYKKRIGYLFIFLTLLASILNTSRFGIIAILITDLILFLKFTNKSKLFITAGLIFFVGIIYLNLDALLVGWYLYFGGTDTLTVRVNLYDLFLQKLSSMTLENLIIGIGTKIGDIFVLETSALGNSFENEFFSKLFLTGIFGLTAFIVFLFSFIKYFRERNDIIKYFGILLLFNIIMVSIISHCVFNIYIFYFVTLLYILLCNYEIIFNEEVDKSENIIIR